MENLKNLAIVLCLDQAVFFASMRDEFEVTGYLLNNCTEYLNVYSIEEQKRSFVSGLDNENKKVRNNIIHVLNAIKQKLISENLISEKEINIIRDVLFYVPQNRTTDLILNVVFGTNESKIILDYLESIQEK